MTAAAWQSALSPLRGPYAALLAAKNWSYDRGWLRVQSLPWSVVSIGNLSVGGAGKTPFVIALARLLTQRDIPVDILSRGYGRRSPHSIERVPPAGDARRYGDEPVLIARATGLPVYVGASRYEAGLLAEADADQAVENAAAQDPGPAYPSAPPPRVHLLDDGFQHRRLARAIDIVLLHPSDAAGALLPSGRLREPLLSLDRADFLVLREDDTVTAAALTAAGIHKPLWRIRRTLEAPAVQGDSVAFCAIAHPLEFFSALRAHGLALSHTLAFRDHHPFTDRDLAVIATCARGASALLTTEKDRVRLTLDQRRQLSAAAPLLPVPLRTEILNPNEAVSALLRILPSHPNFIRNMGE